MKVVHLGRLELYLAEFVDSVLDGQIYKKETLEEVLAQGSVDTVD